MSYFDQISEKAIEMAKELNSSIDVNVEKEKLVEAKKVQAEQKANEVMNTGATAFGTEFIPTNVVGNPIFDQVVRMSKILPELPGRHTDLPVSKKVPVLGEVDLSVPRTEWTTGAKGITSTPADTGPTTGEVLIEQNGFKNVVSVSLKQKNYSIVDIDSMIRERLTESMARTVDAFIINGDSATSGNVNLDGGTPSGIYYLGDGSASGVTGIRKQGLSNLYTIGTLSDGDFTAMIDLLEDYGADLENLLFLMSRNVHSKAMTLDSVKTRDKYANATIENGVLTQIYGVNTAVARDFPRLTATGGKVSSTGGNNTFGSLACIYKPAVQYGFGMDMDFDMVKVPGEGFQFTSTYDFGFGIAYETAGLDKTIALGTDMVL